MPTKNDILIGKIVAPQGLKGDVRILSFALHPEDFKRFKLYSSQFTSEQFHFIRIIKSNMIIGHIDNIFDRNAAELLRGTEVFVNRLDLPKLPKNEFYQTDLIGFTVIQNNIPLGIIDCFHNFGAGDIIELNNGKMVSFVNAVVDLDTRKVSVQ